MKVSYSEKTVSISELFTFAEMATLEDLLQTAAMESSENSDAVKTTQLLALADRFGIDVDIDNAGAMLSDLVAEAGNSQAGQDSETTVS